LILKIRNAHLLHLLGRRPGRSEARFSIRETGKDPIYSRPSPE